MACVHRISLSALTLAICLTQIKLSLHGKEPNGSAVPATTPKKINRASNFSPWDLQKLSKTPSYQWLDVNRPVRSLRYTGENYQGKPSTVFAYFASPATLEQRDAKPNESFPAVVLLHGGGGTAFKIWAELWAKRGYAAIAMDLAGHQPDENDPKKRTRLPDGGPDQSHVEKFNAILTLDDHSDDWSYHAVANSILAHSWILSLPEVDAKRTAVTGISWGGYLTCIVSSIDSRFKAAVPIYGCGYLHENSTWLDEFKKLGPENTLQWVKWYDPSSWLSNSRVPTFFINGTNDFAYPLDSYMKSYRSHPAAKNIRIQINMPHGHEVAWAPKEIGLYIDHALGIPKAQPLAMFLQVPEIQNQDQTVSATFHATVPIAQAAIHHALPEDPKLPINQRKWHSHVATIQPLKEKDTYLITAPAPPPDADLFFLTLTDERDAMVSSEVVIR